MRKRTIWAVVLLVLLLGLPQRQALADIAPPKMPPGTTLVPGQEQTQVRMMAETVTLAISKDPAHPDAAIARTDAVFTMRNLGGVEEHMAVRFPLAFFDGSSDGRSAFPEIPRITAKVDGKPASTRRQQQPPFDPSPYGIGRADVPWAVFEVTFPPTQDVTVEITYTVDSYGYYPQAIFDYILQTGAAWNGTIGSVDLVVSLPYEANERNVLMHDSNRTSVSTPGGVLNGNEIRWHYADMEPTAADNLEVILVTPSLWQAILNWQDAVKRNPKDGEAWGMLAKSYKQAELLPKGWLRDDPGGQELVRLSESAYQTCVMLLPEDPLWHYGYADMLWSDYYFDYYSNRTPDTQSLLPRALAELQASLAVDPNNALAKGLLESIQMMVPGSVQGDGSTYDFLALTATPVMPTPYPGTPTETAQPAPTSTMVPATTGNPTAQPTASVPSGGNPLCGGSALLLALPGAAALWKQRGRRSKVH